METYTIQLNGKSLTLKTEHNNQTLEVFKSKVEEKINQIKQSHSQISLEKLLLLTCLCLAEDNYFLKESINKNLNGLESQVQDVLKGLESSSQSVNFQVDQGL